MFVLFRGSLVFKCFCVVVLIDVVVFGFCVGCFGCACVVFYGALFVLVGLGGFLLVWCWCFAGVCGALGDVFLQVCISVAPLSLPVVCCL